MSIKITLTETSESTIDELLADLKEAKLEEILDRHGATAVVELTLPNKSPKAPAHWPVGKDQSMAVLGEPTLGRTPARYRESRVRGILPVDGGEVGVSFESEGSGIFWLRMQLSDIAALAKHAIEANCKRDRSSPLKDIGGLNPTGPGQILRSG